MLPGAGTCATNVLAIETVEPAPSENISDEPIIELSGPAMSGIGSPKATAGMSVEPNGSVEKSNPES
jgi:hypothetical protein